MSHSAMMWTVGTDEVYLRLVAVSDVPIHTGSLSVNTSLLMDDVNHCQTDCGSDTAPLAAEIGNFKNFQVPMKALASQIFLCKYPSSD